MSHLHDYGFLPTGTSETCIVLWGAGFAVLQVDFTDDWNRPVISLVKDDGMSQTLSIDFKDATTVDVEKRGFSGPVHQRGACAGWSCSAQDDDCFSLRLTNDRRGQTLIIQSDAYGIMFHLSEVGEDSSLVMGISTESLISMNLWPALPLLGVTEKTHEVVNM
jgi:hypothetical protein